MTTPDLAADASTSDDASTLPAHSQASPATSPASGLVWPVMEDGEDVFDWMHREDVAPHVQRVTISRKLKQPDGSEASDTAAKFNGVCTREQAEDEVRDSAPYTVHITGEKGHAIRSQRNVMIHAAASRPAPAQKTAAAPAPSDAKEVPEWVRAMLDNAARESKAHLDEMRDVIKQKDAQIDKLREERETRGSQDPLASIRAVGDVLASMHGGNGGNAKQLEFDQAEQIREKAYERGRKDGADSAKAELYHELRRKAADELRAENERAEKQQAERVELLDKREALIDERDEAITEQEEQIAARIEELDTRESDLDDREEKLTKRAEDIDRVARHVDVQLRALQLQQPQAQQSMFSQQPSFGQPSANGGGLHRTAAPPPAGAQDDALYPGGISWANVMSGNGGSNGRGFSPSIVGDGDGDADDDSSERDDAGNGDDLTDDARRTG